MDYSQARKTLNDAFSKAEAKLVSGIVPAIDVDLLKHYDAIFSSRTQSYREVLLGCTLARMIAKSIDIHLPYVSQGDAAFNARDLDEKVVNPFLHSKRIPSSKGPYLSTFRRQVKFDQSTRDGLRDKQGYDSLLFLIDYLAQTNDDAELQSFLEYLLYKLAELREASEIALIRIQRFRLEQYKRLISELMAASSGGLFPVLLVVSMFMTIKEFFEIDWRIEWQPINVADAPSGASGDVTIYNGEIIILSIEVTQRQVDRARLISIFNTKVAPRGIEDYLFLVGALEPTEEARRQANRYFAQGHEVNFAQLGAWITMMLATLGKRGRDLFNKNLMTLLDRPEIPKAMRATWNEVIEQLF